MTINTRETILMNDAQRYAAMSNIERAKLDNSDPGTFARLRAAWEKAGMPEAATPKPARAERYEALSNRERAQLHAEDPERFSALRTDWLKRGEPLESGGA